MGPTWGPPGSCRPQVGPMWPREPCYQGTTFHTIISLCKHVISYLQENCSAPSYRSSLIALQHDRENGYDTIFVRVDTSYESSPGVHTYAIDTIYTQQFRSCLCGGFLVLFPLHFQSYSGLSPILVLPISILELGR